MTAAAWICIVTAVLILQFALGVGIGRAADLRDTKTPPPGVLGEAAPGRRAHLRAVR